MSDIGSTFGNIFGSKSERAEEAVEIFKQAATNYKLGKKWDEAAAAYMECLECDRIMKGGDAADYLIEAANMKEKVNTAGTPTVTQKALNCWTRQWKYTCRTASSAMVPRF